MAVPPPLIRPDQALELSSSRANCLKHATRTPEPPAGAIVWSPCRFATRRERKPEWTALSRCGPEPEPAADHTATCSSICTGDFHRLERRRTNAGRGRSSKQDQYRRERFPAAASTVWRNLSARQTVERHEADHQNEAHPTLAIGQSLVCYNWSATDNRGRQHQIRQKRPER